MRIVRYHTSYTVMSYVPTEPSTERVVVKTDYTEALLVVREFLRRWPKFEVRLMENNYYRMEPDPVDLDTPPCGGNPYSDLPSL